MKRQHPDNPNLFWCPKCGTYKEREEFYIDKSRYSEISGECKKCIIERTRKNHRRAVTRIPQTPEQRREYKHQWYIAHRVLKEKAPKEERICLVEGCCRRAHGVKYCNKHYLRWRKYGDPLYIYAPSRDVMCKKCGSKRIEHKDQTAKGGIRLRCPNCDSRNSKKYRAEKGAQIKARRMQRYKENPYLRMADLDRTRAWYENNKEYAYKRSRDYALKHKEQILRYTKKSSKKMRDLVSDSYIKRCLSRRIKRTAITTKMIELKRQAITIKRIERSMINELTGRNNQYVERGS